MADLKKLKDERARLHVEMRDMHEKAEKEDRGFNAAETEKWNNYSDTLDQMDLRIKNAETIESRAREFANGAGRVTTDATDQNGDAQEVTESGAFRSWILGGMNGLTQEERSIMQKRAGGGSGLSNAEQRALSAVTGNAGGVTVPQGFYNQLEMAMKAFGGILEVADIIPTDSGNDMPMPGFNNGFPKATILGENTAPADDSGTPFLSTTLKAYNYVTPILKIPYQFLQDSAFGEGYLAAAIAESIWRAINEHGTTGTGTAQPQGIVTAAGTGKVGTTGSTVTFSYDDLVDLEHSVDPAYRQAGKFMLSDAALKVARKLKDSQNRPLWVPSMVGGVPASLNGRDYVINQDMAAPAANAKTIAFGDFKKLKVRLVRDVSMIRLTERFADSLQVGLLAHMRADVRYFDANGGAVKLFQHSAT